MARQLWLLRHADAEPHGTRPDAQRTLTERGEQQSRVAGLALARMQPDIELALVSPKVRAVQTAELAAEAAAGGFAAKIETHRPLHSGYGAAQALEDLAALGRHDGRLMVVGHEPDLSRVIGDLTGAAVSLKKAGLAVLRLDGAGGELVLLLRPRELALIARAGTDAI